MSLKEIKDRVEREHPDWTKRQQLEEIDRLRKEERAGRAAAGEDAGDKPAPASVGEAWGFFASIVFGMRLIGWAVWGDPFDEPHWYDVLYAVLFIVGICAVVGAYRRRTSGG